MATAGIWVRGVTLEKLHLTLPEDLIFVARVMSCKCRQSVRGFDAELSSRSRGQVMVVTKEVMKKVVEEG
jgi:hypothetical protein